MKLLPASKRAQQLRPELLQPSVAKQEEADIQVAESLVNPAAKKLADERNIDLAQITGTGKGGRITKEDVVNFTPAPAAPAASAPTATAVPAELMEGGERVERRVAMSRMRSRIAERLLDVTQNTASLTTFNEVDMSALMGLRKQYQDEFTKTHNGQRLGFMGFFVKAAVEALKRFPLVNASIDGTDIVYHGYPGCRRCRFNRPWPGGTCSAQCREHEHRDC